MKSKILFIMHMPPPVHGASMVGKYIKDSERVNSSFECRYINMTTAASLEDIGKGGWRKLHTIIAKLHQIKKEIREFRPDVVYVTPCSAGGSFYKDFVFVQTVKAEAKKVGAQVLLHFHNKGVRTRQDRWLDDKLYRRFFRGVKVMLLAEGLYGDVEKYVARENILICANGIPDIVGNQSLPIQGETEGVRLLWLTNIMVTKGIMEYLEALKMLKEREVKFVADFVGGETVELSAEDFDLALTAMGLTDCCWYHGRKFGDEKEKFFRKADIFVLPSYTEAFPLTILEAMQYGKAVVATNVGGISAEVEDPLLSPLKGEDLSTAEPTGILIGGKEPILDNGFRPDAKEIADAIDRLANDRELCRLMGDAGRKKYEEKFTLEAFEERFVNCLTSLCHE